MKKIQPINNYALVKLNSEAERNIGGIIIPKTAQDNITQGEIAALSAGSTDELAVGDKVIYKDISGTKISHEGIDYLLIPVSDIIAKFVEVDEI